MMQVHLGLDVGKTNLRVGVFDSDLQQVERWSVPTADVVGAQKELELKLLKLAAKHKVNSIGISLFGPLQIDPARADYGAIIESSEPAWSGVNIPRFVANTLQHEVYFDFDVSAGALAMASVISMDGEGQANFVYLSIGTGIGAVLFQGSHRTGYAPQIGHMFIPREPDDLGFPGSCRFHGACLQGLASGRAMALRWGTPAEDLPSEHPAWDLEARYLARACVNLVYSFSPDRIYLGSSVGATSRLSMSEVERYIRAMLNDFLEPGLRSRYAAGPFVVQATLGAGASLFGAAKLGSSKAGLRLTPRERA